MLLEKKLQVKKKEGDIIVSIHSLVHEPSHASEQRGSKEAHRDDIAYRRLWFKSLCTTL